MRNQRPDLQFCNHGSFVTCTPVSILGAAWAADNILLPGDRLTVAGRVQPIPLDHRFLEDIVIGARSEGLVCHG